MSAVLAGVIGDDVIARMLGFQIGLMRVEHHDPPKCLVGLCHAEHGHGHCAVGILCPGRCGNGGNGRQGGRIQAW